MKTTLNRLTPEVVNQIAAGEVIERPASVVKELVDNAIDAEATRITIKIRNGGMDSIEVSDNGFGIPEENLSGIFDAHTTTKLSRIEDLNDLLSMGFRGEALSTITSVAKVHLVSKFSERDVANEISFDENGKSLVKKAARESGTLIKIENLFYNIPARRKYLKTAQTEYRKIYELLLRYFLIYPNIHFVLEKDGKEIENIPSIRALESNPGVIARDRVMAFGFEESMIEVFFDGAGIKIQGLIDHPSNHKARGGRQLVYINNRPITDHGVVRSVYEGYARYLPFGEKISFVINIHLKPDVVDVNVHPRKEEVRFENPFRIYSAVEQSVKHALEKELTIKDTTPNVFEQMRQSFAASSTSSRGKEYVDIKRPRDILFDKKSSSVQDSLLFSKELLKSEPMVSERLNPQTENIRKIFQIFNKYIVIEFANDNLWIMDQHAAAERINYEKISKREKNNFDSQTLLVPHTVELSKEKILFMEEFKDFFAQLGIIFSISDDHIDIHTIPSEFVNADFNQMLKEIFEIEDVDNLKKDFEKLKHDVLATIACHSSVRSGQPLEREEMLNIFKELSACENPYSCPHGRPAIWKLSLNDIDKNFERTY